MKGHIISAALQLTGKAVVNFSFLLGNINFHCATAEGTSHRYGCGSPPFPPGGIAMAFRLFACPPLGASEDAETLNPMVPAC